MRSTSSAVTQIAHANSEGRVYFDRKVAAGKSQAIAAFVEAPRLGPGVASDDRDARR